MMNIKSGLIFIVAILLFCAASTTSATSFDCTKAATHVEKIICSNSEISELDNEVNVDYHKALDETNNELRTGLIKQQKHWLKFTRNRCIDELCLKHAYWSKLAELKTFFFVNNLNIHGPSYKKSPYQNEAEKLAPIKQILASTKMYPGSNQPAFCQQIFDDLKQMKNISFVEAKVKTNSYEDEALDPWKQNCKSEQSLNLGYECDPKVDPGPNAELDGSCYVIYGEQPFKVFEIPAPEKNTQRYILYMGSAFGPMNIKFRGEYSGGDVAGFHELDVKKCKLIKHWEAPKPSHFNSLIKHDNNYYTLSFYQSGNNYFMSIGVIDKLGEYCRWTTINSNSNSGEK